MINIVDKNNRLIEGFKMLVEGDHFGEIALIYKCPRTASCISRNYNTMARLSAYKFRELICDFPELKQHFKNHLYKYTDTNKNFMREMFKKVSYFKHLNNG